MVGRGSTILGIRLSSGSIRAKHFKRQSKRLWTKDIQPSTPFGGQMGLAGMASQTFRAALSWNIKRATLACFCFLRKFGRILKALTYLRFANLLAFEESKKVFTTVKRVGSWIAGQVMERPRGSEPLKPTPNNCRKEPEGI